jgi:hypothetical protein
MAYDFVRLKFFLTGHRGPKVTLFPLFDVENLHISVKILPRLALSSIA